MRQLVAACLAGWMLLASTHSVGAQSPGKVASDTKAAPTAVGKQADDAPSNDEAAGKTVEGGKAADSPDVTKGEPAGDDQAMSTPPETESPPEDSSGGYFFDMIHSGATGLLIDGGWFMLPILLMGIVAAGVIIERYRSLKMLRSDTGAIRDHVLAMMRENRVEEALAFCNDQQGPVPAVLSSGIRKYLMLQQLGHDPARIEEQVVKAMDDYGVHIVAALERHLPVLGTVSSAAPMLGFLGTVAGMITSFNDIVEQMGETNIVEAASQGISQALLTTCFGLIVGIPAFMAFNYFTSVINTYVLDVEESATELIETVTQEMALSQHA